MPVFAPWYGLKYPTKEDLDAFAFDMGVTVEWGAFRAAFLPADMGGPMIFLPDHVSYLETCWLFVHELGHLCYHTKPDPFWHGKREAKANKWAACAMIPQARIDHYSNASLDVFVGALYAHYGPFDERGGQDDRWRAGYIAKTRLKALEVKEVHPKMNVDRWIDRATEADAGLGMTVKGYCY